MRRAGLLETMASGDLDAVTRAVGRGYRPGRQRGLLDRWLAAVERAERGGDALRRPVRGGRDARAVARGGRGHRLWSRVNDVPAEDEVPVLEEVA
jgi:hypothetical protein